FGWLDMFDQVTRRAYPPIDLALWSQGMVIQLDETAHSFTVKSRGKGEQGVAELQPSADGPVVVVRNFVQPADSDQKSHSDQTGTVPTVNAQAEQRFLLTNCNRVMIAERLV